jgi:hypothetical protein
MSRESGIRPNEDTTRISTESTIKSGVVSRNSSNSAASPHATKHPKSPVGWLSVASHPRPNTQPSSRSFIFLRVVLWCGVRGRGPASVAERNRREDTPHLIPLAHRQWIRLFRTPAITINSGPRHLDNRQAQPPEGSGYARPPRLGGYPRRGSGPACARASLWQSGQSGSMLRLQGILEVVSDMRLFSAVPDCSILEN